jgi:hypothetical protein
VSEQEKKKAKKAEATKSEKTEKAETKPSAPKAKDFRMPESHKWAGMWKVFAAVGAVGAALAGVGFATDKERFAFSYLFGFTVPLTLALGAMFFILWQHLTSAGWSVTVRRTAEFFASGAWVLAVLFVPIVFFANTLFPWTHEGGHGGGHEKAEHALAQSASDSRLAQNDEAAKPAEPPAPPAEPTGHGAAEPPKAADHPVAPLGLPAHGGHGDVAAPAAHAALGDPEHLIHEETLAKKRPYLNQSFFLGRAIVFVLFWAALGWWLLNNSASQDGTKDLEPTKKAMRIAPVAVILLGVTSTFGAFDWIMSLEPTWYSTIFGVIFFASSVVACLATMILVLVQIRKQGLLEKEVTVEHFHDLGKLLFGFNCFWAYVSFSQYMLIYYAAIPEEVTWYHHRWQNETWQVISLSVVLLHFIVPFVFIMSRNIKRRLDLLQAGALLLVLMHVVEAFWLVMPYAPGQQEHVSVGIGDVGCLLLGVGAYLAVVFRNMSRFPLIPTGDPRLPRALHFQNA